MAIGRSEDRDTPRDPMVCFDIARMFGTRSAYPIWASGHVPRTKAVHMTAIDQTISAAQPLRGGANRSVGERRG